MTPRYIYILYIAYITILMVAVELRPLVGSAGLIFAASYSGFWLGRFSTKFSWSSSFRQYPNLTKWGAWIMDKVLCPCCRQEIEGALPREQLAGKFTGLERQVVLRMARNPSWIISKADIIEYIWADDVDGGPLNAESIISRTIHNATPLLNSFGWEIKNIPWRGYSLQIIENAGGQR